VFENMICLNIIVNMSKIEFEFLLKI